jgi:predicted cupin superfamily sugar epimerase
MNTEDQKKVDQYISIHHLIAHHSQPGNLISDIYTGPEIRVDDSIFEGGKRPATNAIYYMVLGEAVTLLNNLKSIKYWQYCDGSPQHVVLVDTEKGTWDDFILGDPLAHAEVARQLNKKILQIATVLPSQWVGSRLVDTSSFSLITCTVTPGFDRRDFSVLTIAESKEKFPKFANKIEIFYNCGSGI